MADELGPGQGTDPFDAELEALQRALAEVPAARSVAVPNYTLGGKRMEGRRPMTVQEQTMLENPALQMGRDAGAFASSAVNALGLGAPGIVVDYVAPNAMAAISENEALANTGVPFAGSMAGGSFAPYNKLAQGLNWMIGRGGQMIRAAPAVATPALAAGGVLATTADTGESQSRAAPSEETRQLQIKMRDAGLYSGPIDGITGSATQAAREKFDALEAARRESELETLRTQADAAKSAAEAQKAQAEINRIEQERVAAERRSAERTAGEERLRQMEREVPLARRILRDYGPSAGWGLGVGSALLAKWGINKAYNARSAAEATRANALLGGEGDMPARVGKVNQFWSEGQGATLRGGGVEVPFAANPGARPPFRSNPNAPGSGDLYQTGRMADPMTDATVAGGFAGEAALSYKGLSEAQAELSQARTAAEADPSEMNLGRLQAALDNVAVFQTLFNAGRAGAPVYLGLGGKMQRQPTRPDVNLADAERLRIEQYLNQRAGRGQTRPAQEGTLRTPRTEPSTPETSPTARYQSRPSAGSEAGSGSTTRRSSSKSQTSVSPDDLPEGHTFNPKGKGSKVQGPNGKFTTMPDSTPGGRSVQIDDMRPYGYRNRLDPEE